MVEKTIGPAPGSDAHDAPAPTPTPTPTPTTAPATATPTTAPATATAAPATATATVVCEGIDVGPRYGNMREGPIAVTGDVCEGIDVGSENGEMRRVARTGTTPGDVCEGIDVGSDNWNMREERPDSSSRHEHRDVSSCRRVAFVDLRESDGSHGCGRAVPDRRYSFERQRKQNPDRDEGRVDGVRSDVPGQRSR